MIKFCETKIQEGKKLKTKNLMKGKISSNRSSSSEGRMTIARSSRYKFCMLMVMETVCVCVHGEKNRKFPHYAFSSGFGFFFFSLFLFLSHSLARRPFNPAYTHKITSRVCYDCFECTHSGKITSEQNITFTEMKVEGGGSRQGMETEHFQGL